ncbi:MAG: WXG100 family type VII secretion target [Anaerolineae bacterium]
MRILVTPERLNDLSAQLRGAASDLRDLEGRLGRALNGLDWEARSAANLEGQVNAARRQAQSLAAQAEDLARFLAERAQAFQQADQTGAEGLGATTQNYMTSVRNILSHGSLLLAYMSAGRVNMQQFLDLVGIRRYGPLAPWLKAGVLDQRYRLSKAIGKVAVGIGVAGDVLTSDEVNEKTIGVSVIRNVGEYAVSGAVPGMVIALAGNALVQLVGTEVVIGSRAFTPVLATSQAMVEDLNASTDHLEKTLKRADLGRITKDISEIAYDSAIAPRVNALKAAWEQPNVANVGRLFMALNPMLPMMMTPGEGKAVWEDVKKLGSDAFDFVKSVPDLAFATGQHFSVMGTAAVTKAISISPVPDEWKDIINRSSEQLIDHIVVPHPITVDGWWNTVTEAFTSPPPLSHPIGVSWTNAIQFTPVLAPA